MDKTSHGDHSILILGNILPFTRNRVWILHVMFASLFYLREVRKCQTDLSPLLLFYNFNTFYRGIKFSLLRVYT